MLKRYFFLLLTLVSFVGLQSAEDKFLSACLAKVTIEKELFLTPTEVASSNLPEPVKSLVSSGAASSTKFTILAHSQHIYLIVPDGESFHITKSTSQESTAIESIMSQAMRPSTQIKNSSDSLGGRYGFINGRTGGLRQHMDFENYSVVNQQKIYHIALSQDDDERLLLKTERGYEVFQSLGGSKDNTTYLWYVLPSNEAKLPSDTSGGGPIEDQIIDRGTPIVNREYSSGLWGQIDRKFWLPKFVPEEIEDAARRLSKAVKGYREVFIPKDEEDQHYYAAEAYGKGCFNLYYLHRDEVIPE